MNHYKNIIACLMSSVILITASTSFSQNAGATLGSREYYRHDCSSSNNRSYTSYSLTFGSSTGSSRTIIGDNNMVRDYDTSIVRLSTGGTGFIIDEHTIATAAHCVYGGGTFLDDLTIMIVDSNNAIVKTISPTYIHVPYQFTRSSSSSYDYALISVAEDLMGYGMFQLAVVRGNYISESGTVVVSGFPQEYPPGYLEADYGIRFQSSGSLSPEYTNDNYRIGYNADTAGGDSGGPVYVNEGITINGTLYEYKSVIGIHTSGTSGSYNSGVRITDDILKFYYDNNHII